ncbi:MAG: hypothetical protein ACR2NZ_02345 [Rubripirellula sp.]
MTNGGKDVTVTTDDFIYEQAERSQRHQTHRRREDRSKRRNAFLLGGVGLLLAFALGAPSLVSHSSIGRSLLVKNLSQHGLEADVESVRIGWVTPLRVTGLKINGASGSQLAVSELDLDLTAADLIGLSSDLGQINLRGVAVACTISEGKCDLEQDFQSLLAPSSDESSTTASVKLQDISVAVEDAATGDVWQLTQSSAEIAIAPTQTNAIFAGVLSEPSGDGGSMQGSIDIVQATGSSEPPTTQWNLDITCESLPLSVISLVRQRFPDVTTSIPRKVHGDATGTVHLAGGAEGTIEAVVQRLEVRDLNASDPGSRVWRNSLATLDGTLVLEGDRVIGRQLNAATDFASATIDGTFSRTFSLVGTHDNPLRWLEAIDGTATAEIDLAAFERSLPGVLPLRDEAQLVSGSAIARVVSVPTGNTQKSELNISSASLLARSRGREFVIDPIKLTATVSSENGHLRADKFEWKSQFGSAVGQGDLRSGNADIEIDFGRLTSMLQPIFNLSGTGISGAAQGNVAWDASENDLWRLTGSGQATDLVVVLSNGRALKRPAVNGSIVAEGRWGEQTLDELSRASVRIASRGLAVDAELTDTVRQPSFKQPLPFHIHSTGRIESLAELLAPWLPVEVHDSSGGFEANADATIGASATQLTSAGLELTQPKVAYRDRYFQQPVIKIHFDGNYQWPTHALRARSITVSGDAFSLAAKGNASADKTELDVKWRAKLERIQGSVHERMATNTTIRQVGYRPGQPLTGQSAQTESWLLMGDCEGDIKIRTRENLIDINLDTTGTNLAMVQPAKASAAFQTVGPMPNRTGGARSNHSAAATPIWSEPNLKINGQVTYDPNSGGLTAQQMQVAGDWFATTLNGSVAWNETSRDIRLNGPSRLKMDEVAHRLSSLAGMDIQATGIQSTPLRIHVLGKPDGQIGLDVLANLGWETAEVAGLRFGPATIPVRLTETSVEIAQSRVPVSQGHVNFAGQVNYRPGPLWMRLDPGASAESIRITPDMTSRWLKYLAPLAADATRTEGTLGAQLDEAVIVFDRPDQSHVTGRLNIGGVQMNAGPLATQIIQGVDQLKALSSGLTGQATAQQPTTNLVSMPVQQVDFSVAQGIVSHERLYFEIDRAQIVTSGRVRLDGRLNMIAQVPLDARWLGSELQGLAGQVVTLPIDGTISRPSLDSRGVQAVAAQLGVQAVQSSAENYIQQQLNKSIDKLFGR